MSDGVPKLHTVVEIEYIKMSIFASSSLRIFSAAAHTMATYIRQSTRDVFHTVKHAHRMA
jgi:hypothetical protein